MYECTSRLPYLSFRSSEWALNSARGSSNDCLSRDLKTSNDPKTNGSCSLRPIAQVFERPAKFDWTYATNICSLTMWRTLMASSSSTNHLCRESSSTDLYFEMSMFSDTWRRECVDPVAVACCCLNSGFLTYRLTQTFDGIPFDLTQMSISRALDGSLPFHHPTCS